MVTDAPEEAAQPFQVDLRGVVDLLSKHIYSSPRVYLRELLQNGRDAIVARREHEGTDDGATAGRGIRITPLDSPGGVFTVRDDGIGLTLAEMNDLLSTVGRSSKRDIFDLPRSDYLGQFGIGLLSCFMVADRIVITSRSARGGSPVEWTGYGDGTFTIRELEGDLPFGTTVQLTPRFDQAELLGTAAVLDLATTFGEFLPVPIRVDLPGGGEEIVTHDPAFLEPFDLPTPELLDYGKELLGAAPFDVVEVTAPATGTRGAAFILPFAPPPGARAADRVYLGRMLLGEHVEGVMPEWAFFARVVVDSTGLNPTASRESLMDDAELEHTRAALGASLRRWIMQLAMTQPHRLATFVAIHEVALKALVLHDDELAQFITRWLSVDTSGGRMTIDALIRKHQHLRYAETLDEFRQLASFSRPDAPIVNGGYLYDADLTRRLPELFDGVTVERVNVVDELDVLDSPPLDDAAIIAALERRATSALTEVDCSVVIRVINQVDLPALYVSDPEVLRSADRRRAQGVSGGLWGGVMGRVDGFAAKARDDAGQSAATSRLCLNWNNRVVRMLGTLDDDAVFARSLQVLYVQALLAGHHPFTPADRALMTAALSDLITLSVGLGPDDPESDQP